MNIWKLPYQSGGVSIEVQVISNTNSSHAQEGGDHAGDDVDPLAKLRRLLRPHAYYRPGGQRRDPLRRLHTASSGKDKDLEIISGKCGYGGQQQWIAVYICMMILHLLLDHHCVSCFNQVLCHNLT